MYTNFSKLCNPSKLYFSIAVIASVFAFFKGIPIITIAIKLIFAFIWTYILSLLCNKGYVSIAWFLVLLPYIGILLSKGIL